MLTVVNVALVVAVTGQQWEWLRNRFIIYLIIPTSTLNNPTCKAGKMDVKLCPETLRLVTQSAVVKGGCSTALTHMCAVGNIRRICSWTPHIGHRMFSFCTCHNHYVISRTMTHICCCREQAAHYMHDNIRVLQRNGRLTSFTQDTKSSFKTPEPVNDEAYSQQLLLLKNDNRHCCQSEYVVSAIYCIPYVPNANTT